SGARICPAGVSSNWNIPFARKSTRCPARRWSILVTVPPPRSQTRGREIPMSAVEHETFMRRTLELARSGWGNTHPNPMVGALIVEGGHVVGEGAHAQDGGPHA